MKRIIAFLGVAMFATAAHAEYVYKYADWNALSSASKSWYAAGLFDGGGSVHGQIDFSSKEAIARMDGMVTCAGDNKLTGELLANMIDNAYAKDVKLWSSPPAFVLEAELAKLCQPWMERSKRKLFPQ